MLRVETDRYSKIILFAVFIIMALFLLTSGAPEDSVSKVAAVCMLILLTAAFLTGRFNDLEKTAITPVVISTAAYLAVYIISLFYATTGQFALTGFSYYLGGVSVFFLTILLMNRNPLNVRLLLSLLPFSIAIAGIFSIDAASVRVMTALLESILSSLLGNEAIRLGGFEAGIRMTSVIANPNVFGSLAALGALASAYLFLSGNSRKEKNIGSGLLIVNAVSFLYCFSLGALAGMFFAVVGLVVFAGKEERARVAYVVLVTVIASFLSVFAGFAGMGKSGGAGILPLASLLAFGFVLSFLLRYIDSFKAKADALGGKKILLILFVVLLLLAAVLTAALTIPDSYTFDAASGTLRRAVTLDPGDYQLAVTFAGEAAGAVILIESQSYDQASTHTASILYEGKMEKNISFAVPVDSNICFLNITASEDAVVEEISVLSRDGKPVKSVNPDYLLLPTFMANRLQGIFINENAAQRFVFFRDGLKIAAMSPIIGHGPGAFESKILEVQDYYYVTRSAHNHYIQTLDEVGIIGLLTFLSILTCTATALIKKARAAQNRALYASLSAMFILIVLHAFIEVTFLYGIYNMAAFMIFALISSSYGQKEEIILKKKKGAVLIPRPAVRAALGLCIILLAVNLGQLAAVKYANQAGKEKSRAEFLDALTVGAALDFTNAISYKTSYLANYTPELPESYYLRSQKYAKDLEKYNSFSALSNLVDYYLKTGQNEKAYQALNHKQALMRYDASAWNNTFNFYRNGIESIRNAKGGEEDLRLITEYAAAAYEQLLSYSAASPLEITLSKENQAFAENL